MGERVDLRACWREGRITGGISLAIGSLLTAEMMFGLGLDSVTIDMQHGALDDVAMFQMLQASAASVSVPFVRVARNDPALIMRALDAGALGLFCPQVDSAAEAAAFVSACRYPPEGTRSIGPLLAEMRFGDDYVERVAPTVLPFAMIETAAGLEAVEEIVAVDGLAGVYVGTADLSRALAYTHRVDFADPRIEQALARIVAACRAGGRVPAVHVGDAVAGRAMREAGFLHIVISSDFRLLKAAASGLRDKLAELTSRPG